MPDGQKSHFAMYCFLRIHVRRHVSKGNQNPVLSLLSKPKEHKPSVKKRKRQQSIVEVEAEFYGEEEGDVTTDESGVERDSDSE